MFKNSSIKYEGIQRDEHNRSNNIWRYAHIEIKAGTAEEAEKYFNNLIEYIRTNLNTSLELITDMEDIIEYKGFYGYYGVIAVLDKAEFEEIKECYLDWKKDAKNINLKDTATGQEPEEEQQQSDNIITSESFKIRAEELIKASEGMKRKEQIYFYTYEVIKELEIIDNMLFEAVDKNILKDGSLIAHGLTRTYGYNEFFKIGYENMKKVSLWNFKYYIKHMVKNAVETLEYIEKKTAETDVSQHEQNEIIIYEGMKIKSNKTDREYTIEKISTINDKAYLKSDFYKDGLETHVLSRIKEFIESGYYKIVTEETAPVNVTITEVENQQEQPETTLKKDYKIFVEPFQNTNNLQIKNKVRVDLYNGFKLEDIKELEKVELEEFQKGHTEQLKEGTRTILYMEVIGFKQSKKLP